MTLGMPQAGTALITAGAILGTTATVLAGMPLGIPQAGTALITAGTILGTTATSGILHRSQITASHTETSTTDTGVHHLHIMQIPEEAEAATTGIWPT